MWIDIFKTGTHTDSNGVTKTWDNSDLDQIVSHYNPEKHEAPVVIGHPKDDAPAYGWVEKLGRSENVLYAKLKDIAPEFIDLIKRKLYKKRSIALYPGLELRHVGFLGAMPPAIKGLRNIELADAEDIISIDDSMGEVDNGKLFSEEDVKGLVASARKEGEAAARNVLTREFRAKEENAKKEVDSREIRAYVEKKVDGGIIPPALVHMGIVQFMESLNETSLEIQFSEGHKQLPLDWFKQFIEAMPVQPIFSEIASKARRGDVEVNNETDFGKKIAAKVN